MLGFGWLKLRNSYVRTASLLLAENKLRRRLLLLTQMLSPASWALMWAIWRATKVRPQQLARGEGRQPIMLRCLVLECDRFSGAFRSCVLSELFWGFRRWDATFLARGTAPQPCQTGRIFSAARTGLRSQHPPLFARHLIE